MGSPVPAPGEKGRPIHYQMGFSTACGKDVRRVAVSTVASSATCRKCLRYARAQVKAETKPVNFKPAVVKEVADFLSEAADKLTENGCVNNPDGGCYDLEYEIGDAPCEICAAVELIEDAASNLNSILR